MKRKLLVIFFIAIIISLLIYKITPKKDKILFIGEKEFLIDIKYNKYEKFLYDNITYKELINRINNNDYVVIKNKKIYLNQLISNSNIIIIGANNKEYKKYCNNKELNIEKYQIKINNYSNRLRKLLSKITYSEIKILDNYC